MEFDQAQPEVATGDVRAAYADAREHLNDLLVRHDWLLKREFARGRSRKASDPLGFVAVDALEVRRLLDAPHFMSMESEPDEVRAAEAAAEALSETIRARVQQNRGQKLPLPLIELEDRFSLSSQEIDLLFACLSLELDRRYERIYGFMHDDMSRRLMSTGLALSLYCTDMREQLTSRQLLNPHARLRHYRLLDVSEESSALPWASRAMRVDERIAAFLLGDSALDARIARYLTPLEAGPELSGKGRDTERQVAEWIGGLHPSQKPLLYLKGAHDASGDTLVRDVADRLKLPILTLDLDLVAQSGDFDSVLFLAFREGILSQSALYLKNLDRALEAPNGPARLRTLMRCVADMGSVVFASGETAWCWQLPPEPAVLRIVELTRDSIDEQLKAWQSVSRRQLSDSELHRLISLHPLPVAAIRDVWRTAKAAAKNGNHARPPTLEHLQAACRARSGAPLSSLARRLDPKHDFTDLVLPPAQTEQLMALCSQARHASIVYGAWCFESKLALGRGLNALFSGPPGTGKTMAAEVIARELGVEIVKIDLSQVVSKYIGETEKNLKELFDQAARANAILFFDEADALLGKRSAVKDAHDRYANTEVAFLLQKTEEYPGIAILSTNLRQNLDEAFTRRMRFIIDFPFPEEADRLRIWQGVWPKEAPIAPEVDFAILARQFRLSGGSIRNIALAAAFLAAEQGSSVGMQHLMRATKRELQKMGRLVNEEELRRYG